VDLVKAFDSVNHEFLWKILRKYGILAKMVNVIKCMYQDFSLLFTVGKATEEILYSIGVHQGDNLAPLLFNIFFKLHLNRWKKFGHLMASLNPRSGGFPQRNQENSEADCYVRNKQLVNPFLSKSPCMSTMVHFYSMIGTHYRQAQN
jgi:hypothetical protein